MLDVLKAAGRTLKDLLLDEDGWNSLRVDYNHPYVDRLWRQYDKDHRLLLHKIYPCETEEALLHPHPWPSAVRVFGPGGYETGIGFGDPAGEPPPIAAKFVLKTFSSYEMTVEDSWHYVRPLRGPIYTMMVVGRSFDVPKQDRFGQLRAHTQLDDAARQTLFKFFRRLAGVL